MGKSLSFISKKGQGDAMSGPAKAFLVIPTEPKGSGCVRASKESCGSHDGYGSTRVMIIGGRERQGGGVKENHPGTEEMAVSEVLAMQPLGLKSRSS